MDERVIGGTKYLTWLGAAAAVTFVAAWLYVAFFSMAFMDAEYARWTAKLHILEACDVPPSVLVGDSRPAVNVMPRELGTDRIINLALAGTTSLETFVVVRKMMECPVRPRRVFISLVPSHFPRPDTFWSKSARYRFLNFTDLRELIASSRSVSDMSVVDSEGGERIPALLRAAAYGLGLPPVYFNSLFTGAIAGRYTENSAIYRDVRANRGQYFFQTTYAANVIGPDARLSRFSALPIIDHYFERTIELLGKSAIEVYFLPMPLNATTERNMSPTVARDFATYLAEKQSRHGNFRVLGPLIWGVPDRFFNDPLQHFNRSGATEYSRRLAACKVLDVDAASFAATDACLRMNLGAWSREGG
ncbi:MAG: hypothetical protein JNK67_10350 [Alphaproteobacteria bacterium]|nr:hypothetical protein [Alphaproteobacteria bacterium]